VRNLASRSYPPVPRMSEKVIVRRREEESRFTFSFHLKITDLKIDKQFNLSREVTEATSAFIERLSSNIVKANKKNKGQGEERLVPKFTLADGEVAVNGETHRTVADFLFTKGLCMTIDNTKFLVAVNPPLVTELKMSEVVVAGLLIYPHKLEVEFADQEATEVEWFASEKVTDDMLEKGAKQNKKAKVEAEDATEWTKVGKGRLFKPGQEHVQCRLRCQVTPHCGQEPGVPQSAISAPITLGPGELPANSRHMWTSTPQTWPNMRLVTYNILADLYCDSDFSRTVLHPSCPPYALHIDYRIKLVLHELLGYNSDLVCLQEVDKKVFENHLEPILATVNMGGQFAKKGGQVSEGVAIFWRRERLELIEFSSVFLPSLLQSPPYAYLWDKLKDNPALVETLTQRTTELAIAVLRVNTGSDERRLLVVGNTHLYFKPDADHVRLIQAEMCRRELERVRGEMLVQHPDAKVSIVLCGDFNSTPEYDNHMGGVLQLMTQGKVDENHLDWRSREGEEVKGISLDSNTLFFSAAGTPKYTNYTAGFKDCLDYIFIEEDSASVEQVVPFPTEEELELHTAIPSIVLPSDHIAVVVDVCFR